MSDKIITEIVLEGEKEAIAGIQRVGKAADATFADLQERPAQFRLHRAREEPQVADRCGPAASVRSRTKAPPYPPDRRPGGQARERLFPFLPGRMTWSAGLISLQQ